jgi:hypothetical protein
MKFWWENGDVESATHLLLLAHIPQLPAYANCIAHELKIVSANRGSSRTSASCSIVLGVLSFLQPSQ